MRKNKFLSLLTAAVLTVTGFCQNALLTASAEPKFYSAEIPEGAALAYSENSFGDMIARSINRESMRIAMSSVVYGVEMNGTEATVSYGSEVSGRAVVCVYEDVGADKVPRLLGTGIQDFDAELDTVTVPVEMKALPEYYLVRVYLIGENDVPLSAEYTDPMHTREMQQLLKSDISYYMEDYEVLNLDEKSDTNFAVYNEDVAVLNSSSTENVVLSQDNENCVFEIENYTGPTKSGAIVSVECGNGTAAIFKVDSVETNGEVTTIQGDRSMKAEDAFLYLKLETDTENNSVTYTAPEESAETEGIEFKCTIDEKPAQGRPAVAAMATDVATAAEESEEEVKTYQDTVHFNVEFGKNKEFGKEEESGKKEDDIDKTTGAGLNGFVDFQFNYDVEIYKAAGLDKIKLDLSNVIEVGFELSLSAETEIPLGNAIVLNPISQIEINLGPKLYVSIEGALTVSSEFSWSYGSGQKFQSAAVVTDISLTAEGYFGIGLGGKLQAFGKGGELSVQVGFRAEFATNPSHEGCSHCSEIGLYFVAKLTASLDIGIVDVGIEPAIERRLRQFYLSDSLGFGSGECPNLNGSSSNPDEPDNPENPDDPSQSAGIWPDDVKYFVKFELAEKDGETVAYLKRDSNGRGSIEGKEAMANVTEIRVPEYYLGKYKVVGIGDSCFSGLDNLETVVLPDSIQSIGSAAFAVCAALTNVNLPKNLTYMGDSAFYWCNLSEIIIPSSLRDIPASAFRECAQVKNIVIPEGVKTIGDYAFDRVGINYGTKIKIPMSVESVGCFAMQSTTVMSPIYVRDIGERAFSSCDFYDPETKSNTLILSSSIRTIGEEAFYSSDAEKIVFPKYCTAELGSSLFSLSTVTEVVLPDNMTRIPDYMFSDFPRLKKVHWPSRLIEIGDYAFHGCILLSLESLPRTLRKVGAYSFADSLNPEQGRAFKLPDGLKEIGPYAFTRSYLDGTTELVEFHIPETVEKISFSSFAAVSRNSLSVYFWNPNTEILDDVDAFKEQYASLLENRTTTIFGYAGSTAEAFANKESYKFVPFETPPSDPGQTDNPPTSTDPPKSITFSDLLPNTIYNFYNLLGDEFTAENLLYLSQGMSDSNGTLTIYYLPKSDDTNADKFVRPAQDTTTTTEQPAVSEIKGDVNGDLSVDISDVVLAARFLAEDPTAPIKRQGITNLDVNGDGKPTPEDNIMILRFIAKLIPSLD